MLLISIISALNPIGAVVGALIGGAIGNKMGKRQTLLIFGIVRIVACCISCIPFTYTFAIGRFIAGVFCGIAQIFVPLYFNEIAPDQIRGKVTLFFGISFSFGQAFALCLGIPAGFGVIPYYW